MIEYRRSDGVLLGWLVESGVGFHVLDLLGRQHTIEPVDWFASEQILDSLGIGYLADLYALRHDDLWLAVRIIEASPDGIRVMEDNLGAIDIEHKTFELPFPVDDRLIPVVDGKPEVLRFWEH